MSRQKTKLPPYVSVDKYGYKLKRYEGRVHGKIKWGKTTIIAPADAAMSEVWRAYEEAVGMVLRTCTGWSRNTRPATSSNHSQTSPRRTIQSPLRSS